MTEEIEYEPFNPDEYEEDSDNHEYDVTRKTQYSIIRSRFNDSLAFIEMISSLRDKYTKYSVQLRIGTNDINIYNKHYGYLSAVWGHVQILSGLIITDRIDKLEKLYEKALALSQNKIHPKLKKIALTFEKEINMVCLRSNLSLDVEKIYNGDKAKQMIEN